LVTDFYKLASLKQHKLILSWPQYHQKNKNKNKTKNLILSAPRCCIPAEVNGGVSLVMSPGEEVQQEHGSKTSLVHELQLRVWDNP
jgi:hypothetical protein